MSEGEGMFGSDEEDDKVPVVSRDDLFGSDEEEDEELIPRKSTGDAIADIASSVKLLFNDETMLWSTKQWTARVGELIGVNFMERPDLKGYLQEAIMNQIENGERSRLEEFDASLDESGSGRIADEAKYHQPLLDEDKPVVKEEKVSRVSLPEVKRFGDKLKTVYARMPEHVKIRTQPFSKSDDFDSELKEFSIFEVEEKVSEGFYARNSVIRWRYKLGPDGKPEFGENGERLRESNAFFVEYKSGRKKLFVGSREFEIQFHPMLNRSSLV